MPTTPRATTRSLPLLLILITACGQTSSPAEGSPAAAEVQSSAPPAPSAELRDKLRELAVAAECLRRSDAPNEVVSKAMMDLYAKHGVDLDTYAREMGRLGGDAGFQAEIQAGLASCATPPVAVGVADTVEAPADAVDGAPADPIGDAAPTPPGESDDVAIDPADGGAAPESDAAAAGVGEESGEDATAEPPDEQVAEVAPGDAAGDDPEAGVDPALPDGADPSTSPPISPPPGDGPDFSGTWTGALRGTASGTLRLVVDGTRISSVSLNLGGRSARLQGTLTATGKLSLGGRLKAAEFIRMRGSVGRDGATITGSWDGVLDRKMAKGSFSLTR